MVMEGKLDTAGSEGMMKRFNEEVGKRTFGEIIIDMEKLEYLSSSGLRVLLTAQKAMSKRGKLSIVNVTPDMMEVFELTRFTNILNIQ